ncbi:MAG TPA: phosphoglycerate kinase [Candidatus Eisenbacteria bacterium]|nr:phosphoglycerate kinase [Candidatus Eisenbacteria bacterium]
MFDKATVRDLEVEGKRVLLRADFNVPLGSEGDVADDTRIVETLPTIRYLLSKGAAVIAMSHLGRPKGKPEPGASLAPVARRLARLTRMDVPMAPDVGGPESARLAKALGPGQLMLLENLRFDPGEEKNDPGLAARLAALGDAYVNDAFGAAHRAHASTVGVPERLKPAVAGFLMQKELTALGSLLDQPAHPFVAVIGGAKVSGKIDVLEHLLGLVDTFLIGGGMMFTFVKAQGGAIGRSLLEADRLEAATRFIARAREKGVKVIVAPDCRAAASPEGGETRVVPASAVPDDLLGVDIGPEAEERFRAELLGARTALWNGPMGIFEVPGFAAGTLAVARALADATQRGAHTVVGGGDSVAAVHEAGVGVRITHVSTGGGASLEFLEGKTLPGVRVLDARVQAAS